MKIEKVTTYLAFETPFGDVEVSTHHETRMVLTLLKRQSESLWCETEMEIEFDIEEFEHIYGCDDEVEELRALAQELWPLTFGAAD